MFDDIQRLLAPLSESALTVHAALPAEILGSLAGIGFALLVMLTLAAARLGHRALSILLVSQVMIPAMGLCLMAVAAGHSLEQIYLVGDELSGLIPLSR
ncbi:hypothetical protein [Isoalcanivorax indicus]|uniref:hypothetical protein n=1 Tax=Isoalcanivorax indicus TaxID=2202653 RepID=UPI000DBA27F1|nr:hypothetical protein [Isoalcanivorax indicus]